MRAAKFVYGSNFHAPPLEVRHSLLERATEDSPYRSVCPACGHGLLLVARDQRTFELMRDDRCTSCGQYVRYLDDSVNGERLAR